MQGKTVIIGSGMSTNLMHQMYMRELAKDMGVEIVTVENLKKPIQEVPVMKIYAPDPLPFKEDYPETRKERRARERKNKKK